MCAGCVIDGSDTKVHMFQKPSKVAKIFEPLKIYSAAIDKCGTSSYVI